MDAEVLANLAKVRDPRAARLGRRVLEGQIHMLEAQIGQLTELVRSLEQQEIRLEQASEVGEEIEEPAERRTG
jgi:hypothetical protein